MSQNQEIIEAKLCAFIDGDLDAEGRIEIEKHLEANPQHRRLLESLKATRDLIKWLPREAAPPEVAETLNGQLERSVLLDSHSDFLRPSVWPRVMAAAAIILLTAGLGVAVYFTLPKSQKTATPYVKTGLDTPGAENSVDEGKSEDSLARREPAAGALSKGGFSELKASKAAPNEAGSIKSESAKADSEELQRWLSRNRDSINAVANGSANQLAVEAAPNTSNALVMLVRTSAPQATRKQVTEFLDAQKIQWKETSAPAEAGVARNAFVYSNDARRVRQQVSEGISQTSPLAQQQQRLQQPQSQQQQSQQQQSQQSQQQQSQSERPAAAAKSAAPLQENATQPGTDAVSGPADRLAQSMYVARMSRQQAVSLGNTIAQERDQSTQYKDLSGGTFTLADLGAGKAPAPFAPGNNTLTGNSAANNYVANNSVAANSATNTNSPTTESADASQALTQIDRSAGRRLDNQPVLRGGGGFGGGGGGVGGGGFGAAGRAGSFAASAPSTQSTTDQTQAPSYRIATPSTQSDVALPPAPAQVLSTQTAATQSSTTRPADDTLDIVIVVDGPSETPNAASPSAPATQPAATQPTSPQ